MDLAQELGMSLTQCMRETTHRQFLVWRWKLLLDFNRPSRTDHYLMRLTMEVVRANLKNPNAVELGKFKLPFDIKEVKPQVPDEAQRAKAARASFKRWAGMVGAKTKAEDRGGN